MTPEPYRSLRPVPVIPETDWALTAPERERLAELARESGATVAVEIGCLYGHSSVAIARGLPAEGRLYCVDPWLYDPRTVDPGGAHLLAPIDTYRIFLSHVAAEGLEERIIPVRMESAAAAEALDVEPGFVFVDGSHAFRDVLLDVLLWTRPGALVAGHDYKWESVRRAVDLTARLRGRELRSAGRLWWMPPR